MPVPLGFWAAAGAGAGAASNYELITTTYGTGSSGTVTFSSIPQTYKHLQLRMVTRLTGGAGGMFTYLRFNGVSTSSYATHRMEVNGGGLQSYNGMNAQEIGLGWTAGFDSNVHSPFIVDILDYASSAKTKTIKSSNGNNTSGVPRLTFNAGYLNSTTAISSITITLSDSFTTTSRFSLYGIKG